VAQACIIEGIRTNLVLRICQISRSSYYYKPQIEGKKVGKPASTFTKKITGGYDNDSIIVEEILKLLALPFVDYGYLKTTFYLRDEKNYLINPKKVYRLMAENGLLSDNKGIREHSPRQWVKELVPNSVVAFSYFERFAAAI
jgi:putative transposase